VVKTATDTVANMATKKDINKENINILFSFWNSKEIIQHKFLTGQIENAISGALKDYTVDEIKTAISNYSEIIKDDAYFFNYKWGLRDFLKRGLDKFMDWDTADNNYRYRDINEKPPPQFHFNFIGHKNEESN